MADDQDRASGQDASPLNELRLDVGGMQCINCAALVERRLAQVPQVRRVSVDYPSGRTTVTHAGALDITDLQKVVGDDGYTLSMTDGAGPLALVGPPRVARLEC